MNAYAHASAVPVSGPKLDNRRMLAALIDLAVVAAGGAAILAAAGVLGAGLSEVGMPLLGVVVAWALYYYFACESGGGQTLGKRVMNLRAVKTNGAPMEMRDVAVRTVLRVVDTLVIGLVAMLATGERRGRLGDLAADTMIVSADSPSVAPAVAAAPTVVVEPVEEAELEDVELPELESEPEAEAPTEPMSDLATPSMRELADDVASMSATAPVDEPVVEVEPVVEAEPVVDVTPEPSFEEAEPVVDAEPVVEAEPVVDVTPEPSVEEAVVEVEPVVEAEPVVEVEPVVEAEPVVELAPAPAFEEEPVAEAEPVVELAPPPPAFDVVESDPVADLQPEPVVEDEPVAEPQPVVPLAAVPDEAEEPAVTVKSVETVSAMDLIMGGDESADDSRGDDEPPPGPSYA